jgi:release factor glutamine methyltransferase
MAVANWTCKSVLDWTCGYLTKHGDDHPRLSAEWLLGNVTGLSRIELYTNFDRPLTHSELDAMHQAIKRRAAGEPLQYVTGEMAFRHIVVRCQPDVLIPRPETELLVDIILEEFSTTGVPSVPALMLEVGCGTGCIACSLAHERSKTHIVATDLSSAAVELTTRNRDALHLKPFIDVVNCDLATGVNPCLMGHFDVLVSNPPYIPSSVITKLPHEVSSFEPHLALDGGVDGLDVYRKLLDLAPKALVSGGLFAVELFETKLEEAAHLARKTGYWRSVEIREDYTHRPRFIVARRV